MKNAPRSIVLLLPGGEPSTEEVTLSCEMFERTFTRGYDLRTDIRCETISVDHRGGERSLRLEVLYCHQDEPGNLTLHVVVDDGMVNLDETNLDQLADFGFKEQFTEPDEDTLNDQGQTQSNQTATVAAIVEDESAGGGEPPASEQVPAEAQSTADLPSDDFPAQMSAFEPEAQAPNTTAPAAVEAEAEHEAETALAAAPSGE